MKTDYKFWYILRDSTGLIVQAAVRFYEGEYQNIDGEDVYVRSGRLQSANLIHLGKDNFKKEANGNDTVIYTKNDFGRIETEYELLSFLNNEIVKDPTREVINKQKLKV